MPEISERFLEEYAAVLPYRTLKQILRAFYYFEDNPSECDRLMGIIPRSVG